LFDSKQTTIYEFKGYFMLENSKIQYPPLQLIQTWVWMMIESGNPELQEKGRDNLISAFGSLAKANEYLVQGIKK
jgi:hypothetical protein|tara:strand:- start:1839 stop:2063 length:225 start_codon:yes stop_codon:yes gene_type:complete